MEDQWARQAPNGAGRAHWHAEQDGINRNNFDQMDHLTSKGTRMKRSEQGLCPDPRQTVCGARTSICFR
jgi:hypothetical protein